MKKLLIKDNAIQKAYANNLIGILLLLQPLLNSYSITGIQGSLSDISIVIIIGIWLLLVAPQKELSIRKHRIFFLPFLGYIMISWIATTALCSDNVFADYFRIVIRYFLLVTLILPDIKINNQIKKWFSTFSFLLTIYCAMQYIAMNFWKIYLPSYIPFFNFREDLKYESDYLNYPWFYRPHSIFQEPAHFCEFTLVYLALLLFDKQSNVKNYALRIFVSAVILLTGSTTGFVGVIILWGLFVKTKINRKVSKDEIVSFIIIIPIAIFMISRIILNSNSFNILIQRIFLSGSAMESRFGNIVGVLNQKRNLVHSIFGSGYKFDYFADKIGWLPSYTMILLYFGILGLTLFLFSLTMIYVHLPKNKLSKSLFILFIILNIATEMFFDMHLVMYLFVIFCYEEKTSYAKLPKSQYCSTSI